MAFTSIDNLDALATVTGIDAADEALIISLLKPVHKRIEDERILCLFDGQMSAEADNTAGVGALRATVKSPMVVHKFYQLGTGKVLVKSFVVVSSVEVQVDQVVLDGSFSAA